MVERALLVNDGEVAERWARRWLERRPEDAEALCALGKALRARHQLTAAIDVLRRAVALYERQPASDPLRYGDALKQLGLSLYYDGAYADAAKPMRRALRLLREARGAAHPSSVEALARLNDIVLSDGKYAEAERLLEQAIDLRNTVAGRERGGRHIQAPRPPRAAELTQSGRASTRTSTRWRASRSTFGAPGRGGIRVDRDGTTKSYARHRRPMIPTRGGVK